MSYSSIQTQLLKQIRGRQSQLELSRRLGFRSNRIHKWESRQRQIKWKDFVRLCQLNEFPIQETLAWCLKFVHREFQPERAAEIIQQFFSLYGLNDNRVVARRLHVHPSAVRRWLSGRIEPDLQMMLQIFDLAPDFIDLFLERLGNNKSAGVEGAGALSSVDLQLLFLSYFPWGLAIIAALETSRFENFSLHKLKELSSYLGIDENILHSTLDLMLKAQIITKNSDETILLARSKFNFSNLPVNDVIRASHFWNDRVQRRIAMRLQGKLLKTTGHCYFSDFRVAAVTKDAQKKIDQTIAEFVGRIVSIVSNQQGPRDEISCLILHHFHPGVLDSQNGQELDWQDQFKGSGPELLKILSKY